MPYQSKKSIWNEKIKKFKKKVSMGLEKRLDMLYNKL